MLIDNALVYGEQSMTDDAASLRLISTQAPALMSALEVMAEQCYKRCTVSVCFLMLLLYAVVYVHGLQLFGQSFPYCSFV